MSSKARGCHPERGRSVSVGDADLWETIMTISDPIHQEDRPPVALSSRAKFLLVAAAALAAALKIYCAATTYGSSDVTTFCRFGATIHSAGLGQMYRLDSYFNHTPFTGHFVAWAYTLSAYLTPG